MELQIVGISKDGGNHLDPHEGITHYQWIDSDGSRKLTDRPTMVEWAKKAGNWAYVSDGYTKAFCQVRSNGRIEFLQTVADGRPTNNLLSLPEI
jgi:hypothetical protein